MGEVTTFQQLLALEAGIRGRLAKFPVDEILLAIRDAGDRIVPFVAAGLASFAVRSCGPPSGKVDSIAWRHLGPLVDAVAHYLLTDPIVFDEDAAQDLKQSSPSRVLLRIMGSQFPYHVNGFEAFARSLVLFEEIPQALKGQPGIPDFDFDERLRAITGGLALSDIVKFGFVGWALSHRPRGLTKHSLEELRQRGLRLGTPAEMRLGFQLLSASPAEFRELHAQTGQSDSRFGMYEFNPLHRKPLIRPWGEEPFWSERGSRMIAPVPDLIAARVSLGNYHQMLTTYGFDFTQYFGHVFSEYCGYLLRGAGVGSLLSEDDIRRRYPSSKGRKAPDWVIVDGSTAILVECKATRFTRAAISTGAEQAVNDSLKQVLKGFKQLHLFREACKAGTPGLEALHHCTDFLPVVLTLEQLYGVNSSFFRDDIDALLRADGVVGLPWRVVAMEELEYVERHVRGGIPWTEALATIPSEEVIADYVARTGMKTNENACLFPKYLDLMDRLGVPDREGAVVPL
ncbi:MAG TPA: hypothetical protein VF613_20955 [Longimicrobium sp.]